MNRATIALTGATALIVIGAIPLEDAYHSLDLDTLTLLFAMMIINYNLRRAGFFQIVANRVIHHAHTPRQLLAYIIVASGVLSAIFLNDTIVLVFTPLVLDICLTLNQRPIPYLVALVTAANIGSVATIIGNPQNMLIGVSSGISFNAFTAYLAPVALAGLVVIWVVVALVFHRDLRGRLVKEPVVGLRTERRLLGKSLFATAVMVGWLRARLPDSAGCAHRRRDPADQPPHRAGGGLPRDRPVAPGLFQRAVYRHCAIESVGLSGQFVQLCPAAGRAGRGRAFAGGRGGEQPGLQRAGGAAVPPLHPGLSHADAGLADAGHGDYAGGQPDAARLGGEPDRGGDRLPPRGKSLVHRVSQGRPADHGVQPGDRDRVAGVGVFRSYCCCCCI
jgi:hypothetical protein